MGDADLEQVSKHDHDCVVLSGTDDLTWRSRLGVRACKRCSSSRASRAVRVVSKSRSSSVKVREQRMPASYVTVTDVVLLQPKRAQAFCRKSSNPMPQTV